MFEPLGSAEIITLVSVFSLMWFLVGLYAGKGLIPPPKSRPARRSGARKSKSSQSRPPRRKDERSGEHSAEEIYVGNLSYDIGEKELRKTFERFGPVSRVRLIEHRMSGKSKGYAFVEMGSRAAADAAVKGLNGKEVKGRSIVVNEARTRKRR